MMETDTFQSRSRALSSALVSLILNLWKRNERKQNETLSPSDRTTGKCDYFAIGTALRMKPRKK